MENSTNRYSPLRIIDGVTYGWTANFTHRDEAELAKRSWEESGYEAIIAEPYISSFVPDDKTFQYGVYIPINRK
jgi:hypothetical protein